MDQNYIPDEQTERLNAESDSSSGPDIDMEQFPQSVSLLDSGMEHWWVPEASSGEGLLAVVPGGLSSLLESYFALFGLCVAWNIPTKFLGIDFKVFPYTQQWFKGEITASEYRLVHREDGPHVVEEQQLKENEQTEVQPELVPRLHRLIGALHDSKRRFVSANLITRGVDVNVTQGLQSYDHLSEVFPQFIKNLHTDTDLCLKQSKATASLFLSKALHRPNISEPFQTTSLSVLNFSPENYAPTLYEMFNPMLLPEPVDNGYEIENAFDSLAPVFTIIFDDMDETTEDVNLSHGVEVPLEFYPQLYSKNCLEKVVIPVWEETEVLRRNNKLALNKMSSLQSFQGKQISSFLNSSISYLNEIPLGEKYQSQKLSQTLETIKDQLTVRKRDMMGEYSQVQKQINELSFERPSEKIIELAKEVGAIDEPYLLRLAAFSPYDYIMATGNSNDKETEQSWTRTRINVRSTEIVQDSLTGLEAQDIIKAATRHASETPILFVFVKRGVLDSQADIQAAISKNKALSEFLQQDKHTYEQFQQQLKQQQPDLI